MVTDRREASGKTWEMGLSSPAQARGQNQAIARTWAVSASSVAAVQSGVAGSDPGAPARPQTGGVAMNRRTRWAAAGSTAVGAVLVAAGAGFGVGTTAQAGPTLPAATTPSPSSFTHPVANP